MHGNYRYKMRYWTCFKKCHQSNNFLSQFKKEVVFESIGCLSLMVNHTQVCDWLKGTVKWISLNHVGFSHTNSPTVVLQEALAQIQEYSEAGITVRGTYFPPNKEPKEGERKLYLAIEATAELSIQKAKKEITRLIKEELIRLVSKTDITSLQETTDPRQSEHVYNLNVDQCTQIQEVFIVWSWINAILYSLKCRFGLGYLLCCLLLTHSETPAHVQVFGRSFCLT